MDIGPRRPGRRRRAAQVRRSAARVADQGEDFELGAIAARPSSPPATRAKGEDLELGDRPELAAADADAARARRAGASSLLLFEPGSSSATAHQASTRRGLELGDLELARASSSATSSSATARRVDESLELGDLGNVDQGEVGDRSPASTRARASSSGSQEQRRGSLR